MLTGEDYRWKILLYLGFLIKIKYIDIPLRYRIIIFQQINYTAPVIPSPDVLVTAITINTLLLL